MKIIEDEVVKTVSEPIREPVRKPVYTPPKPVLNNEEEVDEYLFRVGKKKELPFRAGREEKTSKTTNL